MPTGATGIMHRAMKFQNAEEFEWCEVLVNFLRKGAIPLAFIYKTPQGSIEIQGSPAAFSDVRGATQIMDVAKAKLISLLLGKNSSMRA